MEGVARGPSFSFFPSVVRPVSGMGPPPFTPAPVQVARCGVESARAQCPAKRRSGTAAASKQTTGEKSSTAASAHGFRTAALGLCGGGGHAMEFEQMRSPPIFLYAREPC